MFYVAHAAYSNAALSERLRVPGRLENRTFLNNPKGTLQMFDVKEFMAATQEATLDDKFNLHPEGDFTFQIDMDPEKAFEIKTGEKPQEDGSMRPWAQAHIRLYTIDPSGAIEAKLGRKPSIKDSFFLDVITVNGQTKLDQSKQKNVRIGAYLTAVGKNAPGWKFTDLCGKQLKGKVVHVKSDFGDGKQAKLMQLGVA